MRQYAAEGLDWLHDEYGESPQLNSAFFWGIESSLDDIKQDIQQNGLTSAEEAYVGDLDDIQDYNDLLELVRDFHADQFFDIMAEQYGVAVEDFDWEGYREAIGYGRQ